MSISPGSRLGPYEVLSPLGAGGMGEVYKARDTRLERTVAIKVLALRLSSSPESRQRFEQEAKTISQLSHPHICALYDVGREGETEYLVMEYLEGETLSERLVKGPLLPEQTLRYGIEIADALDKAHRQGIVHRDLKPSNVMLTKSGVSGNPEPVTALDKSRGETGHWRPRFLPDGRHFLFLIRSSQPQNGGVAIGSLDSKEVVHLSGIDTAASWAPPGLLLFVRDRTLFAQRFDMSRLRFSEDPFPVARNVDYAQTWGAAAFSVSEDGTLAYQSGGIAIRRLVWFDRSGRQLGTLGEPGEYRQDPRISPDGRRVAVLRVDPESRGLDIWVFDLARGVGSRLTFEPSLEEYAVWSPDGNSIIFDSNRDGVGDIYRKSSTGAGSDELLLKSEYWKNPQDWSRDGRYLLYGTRLPKTGIDLWILPLFGDKKPAPLLVTPFDEFEARFSPDGRWFAYGSKESGSWEIYVQPFPPTGAKWQISVGGGTTPRWRGDGKEILYVAADYMRKAVDIKMSPTFEAGVPRDLFQTPNSWGSDVMPDGQRFLVNLAAGESPPAPITVVLNRSAEVKGPKK